MADSLSILTPLLMTTGMADKEQAANDLWNTMSGSALLAMDPSTTGALTWGYLGGRWKGLDIASDTLTLDASDTNYIVMEAATGIVTSSTATTNWGSDTSPAAGYVHLYIVTTDAVGPVALTGIEDHRAGWLF